MNEKPSISINILWRGGRSKDRQRIGSVSIWYREDREEAEVSDFNIVSRHFTHPVEYGMIGVKSCITGGASQDGPGPPPRQRIRVSGPLSR
jgi:hypothetical protein